jgi:predicted ferric reductase
VRSPGRLLPIYLAAVSVPLVVALLPPRPGGRELVVEVGVGLGFLALGAMVLQFVLIGRVPRLANPIGLDRLMQAHRLAGVLAGGLVAGHVVVLITARNEFLRFYDPTGGWTELTRAAALWSVTGALVLLFGSTFFRRRLRLAYQYWHLGHSLLALFILVVAVIHVFRVSHYSAEPWKMAIWTASATAGAGILAWTRVYRPLRQLRRPYEVTEVRGELGRSWTIVLTPRGHDGIRFHGGQFAWVGLDQQPYHIDTHPFSFASSSSRPDRVEFTIKELGDFTSRVGETPLGATAYIDGPYGNFTLDDDDTGAVFIVGGVGVTPALSMLLSLRDAGDSRPAWLVYAVRSPETAIRSADIEGLAAEGRVHLSYVFEEPPPGYEGEQGLLRAEVLDRTLPAHGPGLKYFVCGPAPMMDVVERLLRERGIPHSAIRTERFNMA